VLAGCEATFSRLYPCHAPDTERWLPIQAEPVDHPADEVVLSHTDMSREQSEAAPANE
jgi:hypothetical protein